MPRTQWIRLLPLAAFLFARALTAAEGEAVPFDAAVRNAVFNGDFSLDLRGWQLLHKGTGARMEKFQRALVDLEEKGVRLTWSREDGDKMPLLLTQYPLPADLPGPLRLALEVRGRGAIAFGVCEYGEKFLRSRTTRCVLDEETARPVFEYAPSDDARTFRPAVFLTPDPRDLDAEQRWCEVAAVALDVPAASFGHASEHWPANWQSLVSSEEAIAFLQKRYTDYAGLTDEERATIAEAVKVEGVLPPYEPIRAREKGEFELTTSVWTFGANALPEGLRILSHAVLAAPPSIRVTAAGAATTWSPTGARVRSVSETEAHFEAEGPCGDLRIRLASVLHYDGLLAVDLSLTAPVETTVDRLALSLALPVSIAKYIRYDTLRGGGGSRQGWRFGFGPVPAPGERVETRYRLLNGHSVNEWAPAVCETPDAVLWEWAEAEYLPYVWLGDEEKGVGWTAESDEGWHTLPGRPSFVLERRGDRILARFVFINAPLSFRGTRTLRFALHALPPKPAPARWHRMRFAGLRNAADEVKVGSVDPQRYRPWTYFTTAWHTQWSEGCGTPRVRDGEALRRLVANAHRGQANLLPYLAPTHIASVTPEGFRYGLDTREWARLPLTYNLPKSLDDEREFQHAVVKVCVHSFFAEWTAYEIGRLIDRYDIDGIYFDNCTIRGCTNAKHGCGYASGNGRRPTVPFLATRRFFMMVKNQFHKRNKPGWIWCHGAEYPGQTSFVDFSVLGEGVYGLDFVDLIHPAEMRACFIGPNQLGLLRVLLPQFNHGHTPKEAYTPRVTRSLMAMTLLHGTRTWWIFCHAGPLQKAANLLDRLGDDPVTFRPYWKLPLDDAWNARGIYVSAYCGKEKALVVVSNLSEEERTFETPLDALLSLGASLTRIADPLDEETLETDGETFFLRVPPHDCRLLFLE